MRLTDEQLKKFAANLNGVMSARSLTRKDLARMIGVNSSTVGDWLLMKNHPDYESVHRLSAALGFRSSQLLGEPSRKTITIWMSGKAVGVTKAPDLYDWLKNLVAYGHFKSISEAAGEMLRLGLEVWERENNREEKTNQPENNSEPNVKEIRAYELKDLPLKVVREEPRRKEPPRKLRLIDTLFDDGYALK